MKFSVAVKIKTRQKPELHYEIDNYTFSVTKNMKDLRISSEVRDLVHVCQAIFYFYEPCTVTSRTNRSEFLFQVKKIDDYSRTIYSIYVSCYFINSPLIAGL